LPIVLGFRGDLQGQWQSVHVWEAWPKTHRFCVSGRFKSYCAQSWVFGVICKAHDTKYMFGRHDRKLIVFAFMAIFVTYCPLFWGSRAIYKEYDNLYKFERHDQKIILFMF
jgi:hypothetical protein